MKSGKSEASSFQVSSEESMLMCWTCDANSGLLRMVRSKHRIALKGEYFIPMRFCGRS